MSSSMLRAERGRLARRLCAIGLAIAAGVPAQAATPVPLAPCRVGAISLAAGMPLVTLQASIRRAFPAATMVERPSREGGMFRNVEVRDGTDRLATIVFLARSPQRLVNRIALTSPRFQLMPGVAPGTPLADRRALGAVTIEDNPTTGVEDIAAARVEPTLAGWEQAGCTAHLRGAAGVKSGLYARGRSDTDRPRPGARITSIEIDL